jgi:type 1 glutamine amidotransferase
MMKLKGISTKSTALAARMALAALTGLAAVATAQAPIKVLFWGGPGGGAHNVPAFRDSITPVLTSQGMIVTYRQNNPYTWLHADSLAQYDVMLAYTTNQDASQLTQGQLTALTNWIASGRVIVALHGSTNTFINNSTTITAAWRALLGARYVGHGTLNTSGTVTRTAAGNAHSCLQGTSMLPPSAANTGESPYWDEGREHVDFVSDTLVLARSVTSANNFPWIWVRPQGNGWVYYNASGHDGQVWARPEFKAQVIRALNWAYEMKVTGIRGQAALDRLTRMHGNELFVPLREKYSLEIMDMQGRRVFFRHRSSAASHNLSFLPAGTYGVNILPETREAFRSLYIKER